MPAAKQGDGLRSLIVELPERDVLKLVRIAAADGTTTRAFASRLFADLVSGIEEKPR